MNPLEPAPGKPDPKESALRSGAGQRTVLSLLASLYGVSRAPALERQVRGLMDRCQASLATQRSGSAGPDPITQRDAMLITYPDQLREPGVAPLRTLAAFAERRLAGRVSGIHLLPFYPSSSDDGFAVVDYFAVDSAYGTWADIGRFLPKFQLMFDGVVNHLSARSDWFRRFLQNDPAYRDFFVTVEGDPDLSRVVRPRALPLLTEFASATGPRRVWTTFSADQVDLNYQNPAVLIAVLDALLFYVARGARYLRLDAVAFLWKEIGTHCLHLPQTHQVIQLLRSILDTVAPHVRVITETNVPHADNLAYFGDGTNEAHLVYNFALPPLVLHAIATGRSEVLTAWAQTLRLPSDQVCLFNFLASHDGIGLNPARGILSESEIEGLVERTRRHGGLTSAKHNPDGSQSPYELNISWFDALSDPQADEAESRQIDRFMVSQAIMLALAGVPGIYFHSLFGSRSDRAAADASGQPRRINRQKLDRAALEQELDEPGSRRAQVFGRYQALLRVRRDQAAFHPQATQDVLALDPRVFALRRTARDGGESILALHNVSAEPVRLAGLLSATEGHAGRCRALLADPVGVVQVEGENVELGPYSVLWMHHGCCAAR